MAWVKRVEQLAAQQPTNRYSVEQLRENIPQILALTQKAEDVAHVPGLFQSLGVHFLVVPHLPHTYLDGAALFVDGHPVIAVTLRHDRIDWFWFTVLHELAHIVLGHSAQLDSLFEETETDEMDQSQSVEDEANALAREWLLDRGALATFIANVRPYFSREKIEWFAAEQHRHPGIVLGQLQNSKVVEYKHLRSLLEKVRPYLEAWIDTPVFY